MTMDVNKEYESLLNLRKKALLPYYGFFSSAICLLFLRKLRQDRFFRGSLYEEMIKKRIFDRAALKKELSKEEDKHDLEANSITCMLPSFSSLLSKKSEIWSYLDEDLPYASSNDFLSLLQMLLAFADKDFAKGRNYASRLELISPIRKILDVKEGEAFMDVFAGFYTLGYGVEASSYYGFDKDEKALGVAYMALIMLGKKGIRLRKGDVHSCKELPKCDKIFLDASFSSVQEGKKSEKLISLALSSLNPNGTLAVLCTSKLLNGEEFCSFRERLIGEELLDSVIALPSKGPSSFYLLLLNRNGKREVEFLDASSSKLPLKEVPESEDVSSLSSPSFESPGFFTRSYSLGFMAVRKTPIKSDLPLKERLEKAGCDEIASRTVESSSIQMERNLSLSPSLYCQTLEKTSAEAKGRELKDIEKDLEKEYRHFQQLCDFYF